MVPKLARPELAAPVARIAKRVEDAIEGLSSYGRSQLWAEAVGATLATARATSHLTRAQLVLLGRMAGGGAAEGEGVERFAAGAELMHLFMLIHDDVMDNAQLRRGRPTLRVAIQRAAPDLPWQRARDMAIVVGNLLAVLATRHLTPAAGATSGEVAAADLVLEAACRAGAGQFQDLLGVNGEVGAQDDEEALRRFLTDKLAYHAFAAPLAAGVRLSADVADPGPAIAWGCHVGLAFQAIDDIADLVSSPSVTGKDSLRDLAEGRPSLPLHFLRRRAKGADRALVDAVVGKHDLEFGDRARLDDVIRELGVIGASADWARAEIRAAAAVNEASGYAQAAREGLAAIERGLVGYLDRITTP
jgi:geranylgeranyl diphosphate synthase type I